MARWRLVAAHYLRVPDNTWEYSETDRKTGRQRKVKFEVPRYLNPHDPGDWTHTYGNRDNEEGEIIVTRGGSTDARDLEFFGDPTPDMVPLDDEAKVISASFAEQWRYKPENLAGDFSQSLIDKFQAEMAASQSRAAEIPGMTDLVKSIGALVQVVGAQQERRI